MRCWKSMLRPSWASKFEGFLFLPTLLQETTLCSWSQYAISFQGELPHGRGDEDEGSGDREVDGPAEESWDDGHLPWTPGWPEGGLSIEPQTNKWWQNIYKLITILFLHDFSFYRRVRTRNWQQSVMSLFPKWAPKIPYWQRFVKYDILISVFQI